MDPELDRALGSPRGKPKRKPIFRGPAKDHHLESSVLRECRKILGWHRIISYHERRSPGQFEMPDGRRVTVGTPGAADLWAVLKKTQRHIEIECKRRDGKGRLSGKQREFRDACEARGIPWVEVKSGKELVDWLDTF